MILDWLRRFVPTRDSTVASGTPLQLQDPLVTTRKGKGSLSGTLERAIATSGAEPGDIVEIDEHGVARVVGRRLRLAGQDGAHAEESIRARLGEIYGAEAAGALDDVALGSNVFVLRRAGTLSRN